MQNEITEIALIGFGEAAQAMMKGWQSSVFQLRSYDVKAFDIKAKNSTLVDEIWAEYDKAGVSGCATAEEALREAQLVFCMVTADQASEAAKEYAPFLQSGAYWLDCNSCAPATKQEAARHIEAVGGIYADVAIMAPVFPKLHQTPMLMSGEGLDDLLAYLNLLDMDVSIQGENIGAASSVKMIRSIMIKGMEALTSECALAAHRAGVTDEVFSSLNKSNGETDWVSTTAYNFERVARHGRRRAAEMREVMRTLSDLGLSPLMAQATSEWQQSIGETFKNHSDALPDDFAALLELVDIHLDRKNFVEHQ